MEEEMLQYAIHSKKSFVFNKCLVSEKGAIWQTEQDGTPGVAGLALWVRHWAFPKPCLHFLSSNTEVAIFTLP